MEKIFKHTALFFDIDATLVDPETGKIPASAIEEIGLWRKAGYACCISTGRSYCNALGTDAGNYSWDGYNCVNGQETADASGKILFRKVMPEELVRKILRIAKEKGHPAILIRPDANQWDLIGENNADLLECYKLFRIPLLKPKEYIGQPVLYVIVCAPRGYDYADYEALGLKAARSYYPYADLVLPEFDKEKGIRRFMEHYGMTRYYGFGDSMNDYEMIKGADIGVAMGSGDPALFETADLITPPLGEDGLARILRKLRENGFPDD